MAWSAVLSSSMRGGLPQLPGSNHEMPGSNGEVQDIILWWLHISSGEDTDSQPVSAGC